MTHRPNQTRMWSNGPDLPLDDFLLKFDENWTPELLEETVTQWKDSEPGNRTALLSGMVRIDLEKHWKRSEKRALEYYLDRYPELGTPETVAAELIHAEYQVRVQFKQPVKNAKFPQRFPNQIPALKQLIAKDQQSQGPSSILKNAETLTPGDTCPSHPGNVSATPDPTRTAALTDTELPDTIHGRYKIIKRLGEGGMGCVFLAHDTKLDRDVALKMPNISPNEETIRRFQNEANSVAKLTHSNILPVFDRDTDGKTIYFTMQYLEGSRSLEDWLKSRRNVSERNALFLVKEIAKGLAYAHEHDVVHRDIKPANILLDKEFGPKVIDFGLVLQTNTDRQTQAGYIMGTLHYMPPEQAGGETDNIGPLVDVYALGVILYQMLTGTLPLDGSTVNELLVKIMIEEPADPRTHRPGLDPEVAAYCLKMLAKKKEDRPQSMHEVEQTLIQLIKKAQGKSSSDVPADSTSSPSLRDTMRREGRATQVLAPIPSEQEDTGSGKKPPQKKLWFAGAGGLLLCLGIVITVKIKGCGEDSVPPKPDPTSGWFAYFDESDLAESDTAWKLQDDDELVGTLPEGALANQYLISMESYSNFQLTLKYRFESQGQIGIHFRSEVTPEGKLSGPRVDLGSAETGSVTGRLSETGSADPAPRNPALSVEADNNAKDGWNTLHIEAFEDWVRVKVNGIETATYHHPLFARNGVIALEIPQSSPGVKVQFAEPAINPLPSLEEEMAKPEMQPPPGRRREWVVKGSHIQGIADLRPGLDINLLFGDKAWQNYDLHVEVSLEKIAWHFSVLFLLQDPGNYGSLQFGAIQDVHLISCVNGKKKILESRKDYISRGPHMWMSVDISIRSSKVTVKLDGKEVFEADDANYQFGRIGCRISGSPEYQKSLQGRKGDEQVSKWRNFEVRHESGKLLWKGLPTLP